MDSARIDELISTLIDRRALSAHDDFHELNSQGFYHQISRTLYLERAEWEQMRRHERQFLSAYAASIQSSKAVLVGKSAARLGGLWVMPTGRDIVQLALPNGAPPTRSRWFPGQEFLFMAVPESRIVTAGGARYTESMRTAIDIARLHGFREGLVAFDSILSGHHPDYARSLWRLLGEAIDSMSGTRGIADARLAHRHTTNLSESPYESWVRAVFIEHGIVARPQMCIGRFRADLLDDANVITEIDGHAKFSDTPHQTVIEQVKRENELKSQGFEFLRLFTDRVLKEEAEWIREYHQTRARALLRGPASVKPLQFAPRGPGRQTVA